jgi:hypothetical protein
MGEFISSSTKWRSDFNEGMKRKYDILQQHADIEGREQVAKAPYYEAAASHAAGANQSAENIAQMHYGPGGAVDRQIAGNAPWQAANTASVLNTTGIAKQKWEGFEKPAMTNMQDMFNENFDMMKSNKKKSLALEGRSYDSPEFAQKTYGLSPVNAPVSPLAVAKPKVRPLWYTGKQTTPFKEERQGPMFAPYGGGDNNPVNWALQPVVPFMRMFR